MANDTVPDKGPITRSSAEALSKKTIATTSATPNRKSERLEKRTPPSLAVKMDQKKKTVTPTPLRRSERTRNASSSSSSFSSFSSSSPSPSSSSSSASKSSKTRPKKQLAFEDDDEKGCHEKTRGGARSTKEDDDEGGGKFDRGKIDECLEGKFLDSTKDDKDTLPPEDAAGKEMRAKPKSIGPVIEVLDNNVIVNPLESINGATSEPSGASRRVQSDSCKEGTSPMSGSRDSTSNENLIRKCVEHDMGQNSISSKRKRTMQDMHEDASAMLVDNDNSDLIEDAHPSRISSNVVETSELCSKRIRRISLSDVKRDWRKSTNNVDQTSSKSTGEKLSTRNNEGYSGGPLDTERPQENTLETEKIRKQQRNLHLLLKPEIAKLGEILRLPDNVKALVENCLEYTMNNYQICTEPASILQAFQLSLCWIAASLLSYKLDFEASLVLAKQHLNFDCKKELVDEINSRLWVLKENFLLLTGNSNVTGYPRASESSNGVDSFIEVTPEVELVKNDNSKDIKNVQRCKGQWNRLLLMQLDEKQKLKKDMENETTEFLKRYRIEWVAMRSSSPHDVMTDKKLRVFNSEYVKRIRELERQHEMRRKNLEAEQLEIRLAFQESPAPDELLLNPGASNELGTKVESSQTCDEAQHHNAPKALVSDHVEGNGFNDIIEVMTRTCTGVGSSEASDANASVVVPCSSLVELQTPLVKHADAIEMDMTSNDGPVSGNKCNKIAADENDNQGNLIDKHSKSKEQCSDPISMADKGVSVVNFSHESHSDLGQNATIQVLLSSSEEVCDGETLVVPSGEVTPTVCNVISSSNDDCVEIPSSRQGELDGTILSEPVSSSIVVEANGCNSGAKNMAPLNSQSSEERIEANGSNSGAKNMAPSNSQSSEERIPSVNTTPAPNCENAAKVNEVDDNYGSNNAETVNSPLSDERISSWKSKSPQDLVCNENVTSMLNCENFTHIHEDDDDNGSNNVILNSPLTDERNADGAIVLNRDTHVGMLETVKFTPSTGQLSGGAVDVSVLDSVLSRPCRTDSPINSSEANAIILSNQHSLDKQNPDGVSSSIPAGQNPVEVSATIQERATVNVLDGEGAMGMPGTVNYTDYPENVTLNSPSMDQISNRDPVLDGDLSSGPCTTSPSNGCTLPGEQISDVVPENNHEVAECQLSDSVVVDKSATLDQLEGVCRTMTENSLSQETPVSTSDDLMEILEQEQTLSSVESPPGRDNVGENQNDLTSSLVDIVPANQSINDSLVMEPPEQEGQLPSAGFLSSNQDLSNLPSVTATENQPSIDDDLPIHIPETSIETQNQAAVQRASNLELDSCSRQVVHPASNMDLDSLVSGSVRPESSDTRNFPTLTEINNHPIQSANRSAATIFPLLGPDPLKNESERLRRLSEQNVKDCENKKLQLKSDFEKELEQLRRKFEIRRKETEAELQKILKDLDTQFNIVLKNRILAEAFRAKSLDLKVSGAPGMQQGASFTQHYYQFANQENAMRSSLVPGPSSCGPPATSLRPSLVLGPSSCGPPATSLRPSLAPGPSSCGPPATSLRPSLAPGPSSCRPPATSLRPSLVPGPSSCGPPATSLRPSLVPGPSSCGPPATSLRPSLAPGPSSCRPPATSLRPSLVPGPSSCGPPAASSQSSYTTTTSQTMVPPIQATQSTSGTFSSVSARLPHINSLSSPLGNVQTVGGIRAPAPHLQPYRPSTSVTTSSLFTVPHGKLSQPAPCNIPATSPSYSHWTPRPMAAIFKSVPHRGLRSGSTGGLMTPNVSATNSHTDAISPPGVNLPNVRPHLSDLTSLNGSKYVTSRSMLANSTRQGTSPDDVVCLSDDE